MSSRAQLDLTREQILAFRRRVGALEARLPSGARSLRQAAWAGLQDSMPRAALLSIHARVGGTRPSSWEDPSLVQVWGPRFSVYVVPARDHAIFTVGRHPDDRRGRARADELAAELRAAVAAGAATDGDLGIGPRVRYASTSGTVLIRWAGARAPLVRIVPRPAVEPLDARRELARRYLHVFGPGTASSFAKWAGIGAREARVAFDGLDLVLVRTPIGEASILTSDEGSIREPVPPSTAVRLLPSGDPYWLHHDGAHRELLVPDPRQRAALWTPRVWPGAVLVAGELVGTWRRAQANLTVESWRRLSRAERELVEAEAQSLPLPEVEGRIRVRWGAA